MATPLPPLGLTRSSTFATGENPVWDGSQFAPALAAPENVIPLSRLGLTLDGTVDITDALQARLDAAGGDPITLQADQGAAQVLELRMPSNSTLISAAGFNWVRPIGGGPAPMLRNYNSRRYDGGAGGASPRVDANIRVYGGIWDARADEQPGGVFDKTDPAGWPCVFRFNGVLGAMHVEGVTILRPTIFSCLFGNCDYPRALFNRISVEGAPGAFNLDGFKIIGAVSALVLGNHGYTRDDVVSICGDDGRIQPPDTPGICSGGGDYSLAISPMPVEDAVVAHNVVQGRFGIRSLSGQTRVERVLIVGNIGKTEQHGLLVDCYGESNDDLSTVGPGNFGTIAYIDNQIEVPLSDYKRRVVHANARIEQLVVQGMRRNNFEGDYPSVGVGASTSDAATYAEIDQLIIRGYTARNDHNTNVPDHFVVSAGAIVHRLVTEGVDIYRPAGKTPGGALLRNEGTVDNWTRDNLNYSGLDSLTSGGGTIGNTYTGGVNEITEVTTSYLHRSEFAGTSGTSLADYTPDEGPGWTVEDGDPQIDGSGAAEAGAVPSDAVVDVSEADVIITAVLVAPGSTPSAGAQIKLRYTDASNFWAINLLEGTGINVYEVNAGSATLRASSSQTTVPDDTPLTVVVTANGNSIDVAVAGQPNLSASYGSATFNATVTSHGLGWFTATGAKCNSFAIQEAA